VNHFITRPRHTSPRAISRRVIVDRFDEFNRVVKDMMSHLPPDSERMEHALRALADHRRDVMHIAFSRRGHQWRSCAATDVNVALLDALARLAGFEDAAAFMTSTDEPR
jgi:hypothetical protein